MHANLATMAQFAVCAGAGVVAGLLLLWAEQVGVFLLGALPGSDLCCSEFVDK